MKVHTLTSKYWAIIILRVHRKLTRTAQKTSLWWTILLHTFAAWPPVQVSCVRCSCDECQVSLERALLSHSSIAHVGTSHSTVHLQAFVESAVYREFLTIQCSIFTAHKHVTTFAANYCQNSFVKSEKDYLSFRNFQKLLTLPYFYFFFLSSCSFSHCVTFSTF